MLNVKVKYMKLIAILCLYVLQLRSTRSVYLQTGAEQAVWKHAAYEQMSEEEDGVVDGRAVWIVSPPPQRDRELSALCQVLQERKQRDPASSKSYRVQRDTLGQNHSFLALLNTP